MSIDTSVRYISGILRTYSVHLERLSLHTGMVSPLARWETSFSFFSTKATGLGGFEPQG